jgi:hypothetical protein
MTQVNPSDKNHETHKSHQPKHEKLNALKSSVSGIASTQFGVVHMTHSAKPLRARVTMQIPTSPKTEAKIKDFNPHRS